MDQKSLETVFLIAICRLTGNKWQSKILFQTIFDLGLSIVLMFSIATKLFSIASKQICGPTGDKKQ